jgi:hypothetical protein
LQGNNEQWIISYEEFNSAMETLGNKAVGIDGLKDTFLKDILKNTEIKSKCKNVITSWLN